MQEIQDTMRRPNQRIIGIEDSEDPQLKVPVNTFNKTMEENFSNLKKKMPINIQEADRPPNRLNQKRNFSSHIVITRQTVLKKKSNIKSSKGKRSRKI